MRNDDKGMRNGRTYPKVDQRVTGESIPTHPDKCRSCDRRSSATALSLSQSKYMSSVIKVAYLPADAGDAEDVTLAKRNDHVLELDNSAAPQLLGWVSRIPQESGSGVALGVAESTVMQLVGDHITLGDGAVAEKKVGDLTVTEEAWSRWLQTAVLVLKVISVNCSVDSLRRKSCDHERKRKKIVEVNSTADTAAGHVCVERAARLGVAQGTVSQMGPRLPRARRSGGAELTYVWRRRTCMRPSRQTRVWR
jgi:hypothetical protein